MGNQIKNQSQINISQKTVTTIRDFFLIVFHVCVISLVISFRLPVCTATVVSFVKLNALQVCQFLSFKQYSGSLILTATIIIILHWSLQEILLLQQNNYFSVHDCECWSDMVDILGIVCCKDWHEQEDPADAIQITLWPFQPTFPFSARHSEVSDRTPTCTPTEEVKRKALLAVRKFFQALLLAVFLSVWLPKALINGLL